MRAVFDKSAVSEQLNFYKEKNRELEERVDTHIKVNKELKDKLENIIKGGSDNNTSVYYKDQAIQLEAKLKDSAMKIEKLNEQIKFLRIDVNKSSSNDHL
jgi:predicted RNase H-like nuclease (RuvC/YqgF family)